MTDLYLTFKSLHVIFMVAWFAGLFYLPRLLIYQTEADVGAQAPEGMRLGRDAVTAQLKVMARRLWYIIAWPAAVLTVVFGTAMLWMNPALLSSGWMQVKLGFVVALLVYHGVLHTLFVRMQRGRNPWTSMQLRFFNEVATVLLFAIVFTVMFRSAVSWLYGVAGILALGVALSLGILVYKRLRGR